jgi:uncharacterized protein (TIGR02757 family)
MNRFNLTEVRDILNELHDRYNNHGFIAFDPVSIPHKFSRKEDIEVSAFLTATIAWGQRSQILKNALWLMELMDNAPYDFIMNADTNALKRLKKFYYRTFQSSDLYLFVEVLQSLYKEKGLEGVFLSAYKEHGSIKAGLESLYEKFLQTPHQSRSMKHIANVAKGSSAKRLNMFLRWMIRSDKHGVDFGLWNEIPSSALYIPLDVHSGRIARELKILDRKQNDWKAVEELTINLRLVDPDDPVRFDYALFGFGVNQ